MNVEDLIGKRILMHECAPGQTVRITITGSLEETFQPGCLAFRSTGGFVTPFRYADGDAAGICRNAEVVLLSAAIPDEPKGIGAVVVDILGGLWVRADRGDRKPWREVLPGTYDEDDACRRPWEHIDTPLRVLSEGIAQ